MLYKDFPDSHGVQIPVFFADTFELDSKRTPNEAKFTSEAMRQMINIADHKTDLLCKSIAPLQLNN